MARWQYRRTDDPAKKQRCIDEAMACTCTLRVAAGCPSCPFMSFMDQYCSVHRSASPKPVPVPVPAANTAHQTVGKAQNTRETKEHAVAVAVAAAKLIRPRPTAPRYVQYGRVPDRRSTKGGKIVPARHVRVGARDATGGRRRKRDKGRWSVQLPGG